MMKSSFTYKQAPYCNKSNLHVNVDFPRRQKGRLLDAVDFRRQSRARTFVVIPSKDGIQIFNIFPHPALPS
jgi:hypothetical protein